MDDNDDLVRAIGRIEGKLDSLVTLVAKHVEDDKEVEKRVRGLERWRATMIGIGAAAGAASGKLMSMFGGQ